MIENQGILPCPKCGRVISYNSYFGTYFCDCGYYMEQKVEETIDSPWPDIENLDELILKTLEK